MSPQILRLPVVMERTGLARSTIYAFVADGIFPKPIQLGPRSVGWVEGDVNKWIEQRITASRETRNA